MPSAPRSTFDWSVALIKVVAYFMVPISMKWLAMHLGIWMGPFTHCTPSDGCVYQTIPDWFFYAWPVAVLISVVSSILELALSRTPSPNADFMMSIVLPCIVFWLAATGAAIWILKLWRKVQRQQEAQRRKRDAAQRARAAEQTQLAERVAVICSQALANFEMMPRHLATADSQLDQAEKDFDEGVFAPFWESIERAVISLGEFDDCVRQISTSAHQHAELARRLDRPPPMFPVQGSAVPALVAGSTINSRVKSVMRKAQKDFHFASIYEQRKTNHILIAGFQNLAQAMEGLGDRIASSVERLEDALSSSLDGLRTSVEDAHSTMSANAVAGDVNPRKSGEVAEA